MGSNKIKRSVIPVIIVLMTAIASMSIYFLLRSLGNEPGYRYIVKLAGILYFVSVAFGTLFVFTSSYIGGAPMKERLIASAVTPFFWMTKEVLLLIESHPFSECLYWYFNPLNIWLIALMVLEMGIATLIARKRLKSKGLEIKIVSTGPLAVIACSLIFVISAYAWGRGENLYVIFLSGYRSLFGTGL
jgi:hypothetical protein